MAFPRFGEATSLLRKAEHMKRKNLDKLTIFMFLLPALLLFVGILVAPLISSAYNSFFNWKGFGNKTYLGWKNYKDLFGEEVKFSKAIWHALELAGLSVFIQLPLSLLLALLLGRGIKGERFFLSVNFMPVLISTVVIGQLWRKIFDPEGLLNALLRVTKILGENERNILWLAEKGTNGKSLLLFACFIPMLWQYVGYHMLLMYAGVKSVDPSLREAAKIDGATDWQVDRYVVIPSMKQIIKVSVIFAVTGSLKAYDLIAVLAEIRTEAAAVPSTVLMNRMSLYGQYGMGSAISVILILLCFFFAIFIGAVFKERE